MLRRSMSPTTIAARTRARNGTDSPTPVARAEPLPSMPCPKLLTTKDAAVPRAKAKNVEEQNGENQDRPACAQSVFADKGPSPPRDSPLVRSCRCKGCGRGWRRGNVRLGTGLRWDHGGGFFSGLIRRGVRHWGKIVLLHAQPPSMPAKHVVHKRIVLIKIPYAAGFWVVSPSKPAIFPHMAALTQEAKPLMLNSSGYFNFRFRRNSVLASSRVLSRQMF